MNGTKIIGLIVLAAVWIWLCVMLFQTGGINLKNILVAAGSCIIIFVPIWKKYKKDD